MSRAALARSGRVALVLLAGCGGGDDDSRRERPDDAAPSRPPALKASTATAGRAEEIGSFEQPVYLAQPGSDADHLYVVERCGRVAAGAGGRASRRSSSTSRDEVGCDGSEQGLLSIAFDPGYERTGRFYVYFTDPAGTRAWSSTRPAASAADPASARELLRIEDFASNHNGGQLQFGPDGMLYIGTGDGGGGRRPGTHRAGPGRAPRQDPARSTPPRRRPEPEVAALGPAQPVALLVRPRHRRSLDRRRRPGLAGGGRRRCRRRRRRGRAQLRLVGVRGKRALQRPTRRRRARSRRCSSTARRRQLRGDRRLRRPRPRAAERCTAATSTATTARARSAASPPSRL